MLATITVDDKKCNDPLSCCKCLLVCPSHVLGLGTSVGPKKFKEIELYKGKDATIRCYVTINDPGTTFITQKTIEVTAEYSYFIDKDSSITVGY